VQLRRLFADATSVHRLRAETEALALAGAKGLRHVINEIKMGLDDVYFGCAVVGSVGGAASAGAAG